MFNEPLLPDSNDAYRPCAMAEPRVLYRSMAPGELVEIMRTGRVVGGGNIFHDGENRPFVFFGDHLNERLLGQGECKDRWPAWELRGHDIHKRLASAFLIVRKIVKHILREILRDGIKHDKTDARHFRDNGHFAGNCGAREILRTVSLSPNVDRAKFARLFLAFRNAQSARLRCTEEHHELLRRHFIRLALRSANQPFTSAVIVTNPILGGLEYRDEFGITLNGGEPEYGFRRGQLTVSDIAEVLLVKNGAIVRRILPESFGEIEEICETAISSAPADETTQAWRAPSGGRLTVTCYASGDLKWSVEGDVSLFQMRMPWIFGAGRGSRPQSMISTGSAD